MTQPRNFKIEDKNLLISCLVGYDKNTDDGVELVIDLLKSLSSFIGNWQVQNLNADEIMYISDKYISLNNGLTIITETLIDCLNEIFETAHLGPKELLIDKFLLYDDFEDITRKIDTFERLNTFYTEKIRMTYLELCKKYDKKR
ncbi:hypothetical protein [Staphylococcus hominis]|jgi:hypothetical protein|nr:hypothetical protein [Staphylococcus aureus]